jgi:CspA family cold shock protein
VDALSTGVRIRLIDDVTASESVEPRLERRRLRGELERGEVVVLEAQVFVEVEGERVGGTTSLGHELRLGEDVVNQLLKLASEEREQHLGDLLGDLRREGSKLERWEFYSAPFRIELSDDLREYVSATSVEELRDLGIRRPDRLGIRRTGTVRWFNDEKGYGRVTADDGEVLFVHYSHVLAEGFRSLTEGQRVSFVWKGREADHGRHVAEDVRVESV